MKAIISHLHENAYLPDACHVIKQGQACGQKWRKTKENVRERRQIIKLALIYI